MKPITLPTLPSMLTLKISAHALHKAGNQPEHYEDAYAFDARAGRAAIADGASDSFEARDWASTLTQSFIKGPPAPDREAFLEWLKLPARAWHVVLPWDNMPWYAEEKAREVGGLATLLGFYLTSDEGSGDGQAGDRRSWRALAVGDACLLHIRDNTLLQRFPIDAADAFGSTPALLCTRQEHNATVLDADELHTCSGDCRSGDLFLMATDAMAERLYHLADLEQLNIGLPDWDSFLANAQEDFEALVEQYREEDLLRNDDVTLLVVRVEEGEDA